jgi:hypothetical protein
MASFGKRPSEQADDEPRKRQKAEADPGSEVKTLSRQLLKRLSDFLPKLPDNNSTKADREKIDNMQIGCNLIEDGATFDEALADMFELDLETDFTLTYGKLYH